VLLDGGKSSRITGAASSSYVCRQPPAQRPRDETRKTQPDRTAGWGWDSLAAGRQVCLRRKGKGKKKKARGPEPETRRVEADRDRGGRPGKMFVCCSAQPHQEGFFGANYIPVPTPPPVERTDGETGDAERQRAREMRERYGRASGCIRVVSRLGRGRNLKVIGTETAGMDIG
jgi:hypothetical protein